jgi:hypothetical protein
VYSLDAEIVPSALRTTVVPSGNVPLATKSAVPEEETGKLVRLAPLIAGNVAGNLASGNVPDDRSLAEVELVTLAVLAVIADACAEVIPVLAVLTATSGFSISFKFDMLYAPSYCGINEYESYFCPI